jgi:hypothetical protein
MPKDKKEKKSKVVETVEDVEMKDASPKVRVGVEMVLRFRARAKLTFGRFIAEGGEEAQEGKG